MRLISFTFATLLALSSHVAAAAAEPDVIEAALANPQRSQADRDRDARDQPLAVLKLAGFGPGMTIADIFGGGGYYSEILDQVVGADGQVLLINNPAYDAYARKELAVRLANHRLPMVAYRVLPTTDLALGVATLDGALIVMSYHDLYVDDPEQGWPLPDASQFIDQIATALKPGGTLLIVDHAAVKGSGKDAANPLHRIDEAFAIADFKAHGLELAGSIPNLHNKKDDRSLNVFNAAIKGKTDRFVHIYRKKAD